VWALSALVTWCSHSRFSGVVEVVDLEQASHLSTPSSVRVAADLLFSSTV
jgi:hypothetical protein